MARPFVSYSMMVVTVAAFLSQLLSESVLGYDLVAAVGAKVNPAIAQGEYWRLLTPVFVHAGALHIFFNMYALYIIGPQVEGPFGHARFLFLYLYAGISGVLLSLVMSPNPSVGASGAVFGLIGALAVYLYRHRSQFGEFGRQRLLNIVMVAAINLVIGLSPGIDNWGHIGGLIGGAIVALAIGPRLRVELDSGSGLPRVVDRLSKAARGLMAGLLSVALLGAIAFAVMLQ